MIFRSSIKFQNKSIYAVFYGLYILIFTRLIFLGSFCEIFSTEKSKLVNITKYYIALDQSK